MSTSQVPAVQPGVGAQHAKGTVQQPAHPPTLERPLIDPKVKEAVVNSADMFIKNATTMTSTFEEVAELLKKVDQASLLSEWLALQKDYRERLWASKDLLANVSVSAEQFESSILPLAQQGTPEAIKAIKDFQGECERIVQESEVQCRKAQEQRRSIAQFLEKLEQWNNDNFITRQLKRRILEIVHRESMLRKEIARLCHRVGFHYIITNVISPMPEVLWRAVDVANLPAPVTQQMKKLHVELQELQQQLSHFQESLHKAEDDLSDSVLSKAYFRVRRLEDENTVKFINNLYTSAASPEGEVHDCRDMIEWLENPTHGRRPVILKAYQENPNTIYGAIAEACRKYATSIQSQ